jgi:hypothetical protein
MVLGEAHVWKCGAACEAGGTEKMGDGHDGRCSFQDA